MATTAAAGGTGTTEPAGSTTPAAAAATGEPKAGAATVAADTTTAGDKAPATTGDVKVEPEGKDGAAAAAAKAPEKYDLKLPDEASGWLDDSDLKAIEALAREEGLSNDAAQAVVTTRATIIAEQAAAFRAVTEANPIYGGDNLAESTRLSALVLDRFAPASDPLGAELRRDLVKSGFGNKLSIVAFMAKVGKAMAEDQHVAGGTGGGGAPQGSVEAQAEKLYGKPT